MMLRFFFYHMVWSLVNYLVRNPHARRAAGQGCLALLLVWMGITLLSAISSVIGAAASKVNVWVANTPRGVIVLMGLGLVVLVGAIGYALIARPTWRERLSRLLHALKTRWSGTDMVTSEGVDAMATPALPSTDDLARIRLLDRARDPGAVLHDLGKAAEEEDHVPVQIVIHGEE
jgi:hypothetical protein